MPEIQEYLPQTNAQEPVGGTSPNIELAGAVGDSLSRVGNTLSEVSHQFHRRTVDKEKTDIYETTANKRAELLQTINDGVRDGSLNDEKVKDLLDKSYDDIQQNITSPEAQNYLERQQSRLRAYVLPTLAHGMGVVKSNEAQEGWTRSLGTDSGTVYQDPGAFQHVYESRVEDANERFSDNVKLRDRAIQDAGKQLARSAVDGLARMNPDAAQHMMDKGAYNQFLNENDRRAVYSEIEHQKTAHAVEFERAERVKKLEQNAKFNSWVSDHSDKLMTGGLSKEEIDAGFHSGSMDWQQRIELTEKNRQIAKDVLESDPRKKLDVIHRILDPGRPDAIKTEMDLYQMIGNGISPEDAKAMKPFFMEDMGGESYRQQQMAVFKESQRLLYTNPITTFKEGYDKAAAFTMDFLQAYSSEKDPKAKMDMLDPRSKSYWGNKAQIYATPPAEQLAQVATDRNMKALNYRASRDNPNNEPPPPVAVQPDETNNPTKFLMRTMGGLPKMGPSNMDKLPAPKTPHTDTAPFGARRSRVTGNVIGPSDDIEYAVDQIASLMDQVSQGSKQYFNVPKYENQESLLEWLKRIKKHVPSD